MQPFGRNRYGPKIGGVPLGEGELGPHLTQPWQLFLPDEADRFEAKFHYATDQLQACP